MTDRNELGYCDYLLGQLKIMAKGNRNALAASVICSRLAETYRVYPENSKSVASIEHCAWAFGNLYSPQREYEMRPWWSRVFANEETECAKIRARDAQEAAEILNGKGVTA